MNFVPLILSIVVLYYHYLITDLLYRIIAQPSNYRGY
jgi:hypothetical protein